MTDQTVVVLTEDEWADAKKFIAIDQGFAIGRDGEPTIVILPPGSIWDGTVGTTVTCPADGCEHRADVNMRGTWWCAEHALLTALD